MTSEKSVIHDQVKDYYGKQVQNVNDLQTAACVAPGKAVTKAVREAISAIHDDVAMRYYGCGLVIPAKVEGMKVLDLGSGSGRDCFALSKLVGKDGFVTGIDMTEEQVEFAKKYTSHHMEKFGYDQPNVEFIKGYLEKLTEAGLKENFFDIIISNCVINLVPDKAAVLKEAYKVLKEGGELYFSDIYANKDLPDSVRKHEVLWGECISGALYWKDLHRLASEIGFTKPYMVSASSVDIEREDFKKILGDARFVSVEYRLFKLPKKCDQTSSQVIYNGEIPGYEDEFVFDFKTSFKKGDVVSVDGGIISVLRGSRYNDEFEFQPPSKKSTNDACCKVEQDDDPFKYIEEKKKSGVNVTSGCCAKKSSCC